MVLFLTLLQILELLWQQKWSSLDGIGAIIISPTRELVSIIVISILLQQIRTKLIVELTNEVISQGLSDV